jgi:murein DD-endopeptidase MepM/ murein hydrolase activator NlpD
MADPAPELPLGSSGAFRAQMLDWSAPMPAAAPIDVRSPERLPLPRLSSRFGHRLHPLDGKLAIHRGIDIPGPPGTPVRASSSGIVRFAGNAGGYGQMVEIDHGQGLETRYAHLMRIMVGEGARVVQGETIALMGSTGRSTGSHLHFEVRQDGRAADPLRYFDPDLPVAIVVYSPARPHLSQFAQARTALTDRAN